MPNKRGTTRPGGRTERVRRAVLNAVLDRLSAGDLNFNFQDVANAAGVHVGTIYARWPERASLVMAAYAEHVRKLELAFSGDWEADLHSIGRALRDFLNDPVEIAANRLLLAEGDDSYREQMAANFSAVIAELAVPLKSAQGRGLVRDCVDPDLIVGMLISPLLALIMFTNAVPDDPYVGRLVDHLIWSCRK